MIFLYIIHVFDVLHDKQIGFHKFNQTIEEEEE
jgi:hypothetical protein